MVRKGNKGNFPSYYENPESGKKAMSRHRTRRRKTEARLMGAGMKIKLSPTSLKEEKYGLCVVLLTKGRGYAP